MSVQTEFVSSKNTYWGARVRKFVTHNDDTEGWNNIQEALKVDAAAWSIFAALLMTSGLGGIFIGAANFNPNNENNHIAQYLYAGCMFLCGGFGFLAVIVGTLRFISLEVI